MAEIRQIGNMTPEEIHGSSTYNDYLVISLATQWALKGIRHIETEPVPTEAHTSDELKSMGLVGVTLVI